jgi:predicted house-cleaning noncanonical NTP pyrophosphatase (MazG superfamily)
MRHDKLVRDNIPDIIKKKGSTPVTHVADDIEYREKLYKKLTEEIDEFLESDNHEELADILEVIYAIRDLKGISETELETIRKKKFKDRGGFKDRIILDETK